MCLLYQCSKTLPPCSCLFVQTAQFSGDSHWQRQCRCNIGPRGQCKESLTNLSKYSLNENSFAPIDQKFRWTGWKQGIQATSMTKSMRLNTIFHNHYLLVPNVRRRRMTRNLFHRASLRELRWTSSFVINSIILSLSSFQVMIKSIIMIINQSIIHSINSQLVCVEPFEAEEEGTLAARAGDRLLVLFPPNQV